MDLLSHHRYCTEIVTQARLLRSHVEGTDPADEVPGCPGWGLGQLLSHLGGAHRWVERIVRTRATGPVPDDQVNDLSRHPDQGPAALLDWLTRGARELADTLREAGPEVPVWTVAPGGTPVFWARRMTYETVVHRADAASVVDVEYTLDETLGLDGVDEWVGFSTLPQAYGSPETRAALLAPGRTLHLRATDTTPGTPANWLIDLDGEPITWRRVTDTELPRDRTSPVATSTVHGPLSDLLLLLYGRRSPVGGNLSVRGDTRLLTSWLTEAGDWLRR